MEPVLSALAFAVFIAAQFAATIAVYRHNTAARSPEGPSTQADAGEDHAFPTPPPAPAHQKRRRQDDVAWIKTYRERHAFRSNHELTTSPGAFSML